MIPNPRGDQKLLRGDHVVCYGKLLALKQLIPRDAKGRRAGKKKGARKNTAPDEPTGPV